jgi:hypothetical protein
MISKDQWLSIQKELAGSFCSAEFVWQDHKISVRRVRLSESKTALAVYIDDTIQPAKGWPDSDHHDPMVEQIWRKRSKAVFSPAKKAKIEKTLGKRRARQTFSNLDKTYEWFDPIFTTAASLVRQFKKLDGLVLIKCGYKVADELAADEQKEVA